MHAGHACCVPPLLHVGDMCLTMCQLKARYAIYRKCFPPPMVDTMFFRAFMLLLK